jgi:hypothetical protein
MKKAALILGILWLAAAAWAGFKVKNIKPKKPEQFQSRLTIAGVTFAADLLLDGKNQKDYFYKELVPSNLIAVRLAVFNNGNDEVVLPLNDLALRMPDGKSVPPTSPESVAQTVLDGAMGSGAANTRVPRVMAGAGGSGDPRRDRTDPRYDPRLDPSSPTYDPNDPRSRGQYPPGTYPSGGTIGRPGVVLLPGGGKGEDLSQYERQLAEKDFRDKAHTLDPVLRSTIRDRFLYFSVNLPLDSLRGFALRLPVSPGIPQEVLLKF